MTRIIWLVLTAFVVGGCTSSGTDRPSPTTPSTSADTSAAASAYVEQLNTMCRRLIPKVLAIRIGPSGSAPTMRQFTIEHPKLAALYETFDADVDALPTDGATEVADVFVAYRQWLTEWDAKFVAAAATGNPKKYNAVQDRFDQAISSAPEFNALFAVGIECPAR